MADEIQAQAEPAKPSTVAEPNAAPAPTGAPSVPAAASSDPNPSPASVDPNEVDFDKVDGGTYANWRDSLASLELPAKAAAPAAPEVPAVAAPPAAPVADEAARHAERIRIGSLPERSQGLIIAATALAKSEGIEIDEAFDRLRAKAAVPAADPNAAPAAAERAPEEIEGQIAQLKAEKRQAANDADTLKMYEIDEQVEALRNEQAESRAKIAARQQAAVSEFDQGVAAAKQSAIAHYPDARDKTSALGVKIGEIADRLAKLNDPLMRNPRAPFIVTQMAAAELGIAPIDPAAAAAAPKVSPSALPTPTPVSRPMQPAPGALRSTVPATAPAQLEEKLAGVNTFDDYESMRDQVFAGAR